MSIAAFTNRTTRRAVPGPAWARRGALRWSLLGLALAAALVLGATNASAQAGYQVVHGFENPAIAPLSLVRGSDGAFYGIALSGDPGDGVALLAIARCRPP